MQRHKESLSDTELLDLLRDRKTEKEGIMFLYQSYCDYLSLFVTTNSGSVEDAQDTFQEVIVSFIHLIRQQKFRGESSIKTFLYSMNRNLWFNELKRRAKREKREVKFEMVRETKEPSVETSMEQTEASRQLIKIMDMLGETCRKILLLFYYENYSMKEILAELNYETEQVVRNKKYKCLKQLEEMIHGTRDLYQQFKNLLHG